jgi:hypothetical protein
MYCISSRGQQARGGPPAWVLGVGLTIPRHKKPACYKMLRRVSELERPMTGSCVHSNESTGYIKERGFPD